VSTAVDTEVQPVTASPAKTTVLLAVVVDPELIPEAVVVDLQEKPTQEPLAVAVPVALEEQAALE
jgi:hypothetical protein